MTAGIPLIAIHFEHVRNSKVLRNFLKIVTNYLKCNKIIRTKMFNQISINRRNTQVADRENRVANPDTGPTAPGYNRSLREVSRILIAAVGVFLWLDHPKTALCATLASIVALHYGTSFSIKNWKWRFVAWGSLPACGIACFIHSSLGLVDEEKAYTIHLLMRLALYGIETCWSVLLWIVIGLAFLSKMDEQAKSN